MGGDHTIALPLLRAVNNKNKGPVALVHFDAHLDTWDTYFGAPYTHGTPFRRAREEKLCLEDSSMQVGIRGPLYSRDDLKNDAEFGFKIIHCDEFQTEGIDKIVKRYRSKLNIEVQDGDEINIALQPKIIQVEGEVSAPGLYKFHPGKRVNDIIAMAGGYSQDAEKDNIYIAYPNGISMKYSRWLKNRKVMDGSIITVGRQKEKEPFDRTEYVKELTAIIANLAQAITMVMLAKN